MNYYNEFDPAAAAWLKELIKAQLIPAGVVDTRSIVEVTADELTGFTQCHFFAGIGGWSLALALAGWREDEPLWTGSCPCQPFSVAGKGLGTDDERHLWPQFRRLIADGKPARVFGEQVASKDGRKWLAGVRSDLEAMGYGVGAADLCAAGVSAPHIRQRLFWLADASGTQRGPQPEIGHVVHGGEGGRQQGTGRPSICCPDSGLADATELRRGEEYSHGAGRNERIGAEGQFRRVAQYSADSGLADAQQQGSQGGSCESSDTGGVQGATGRVRSAGNAWDDFIWIPCSDGKARRIEPGLAPLVDGFPGRVGLVRGYGNAICVQAAAQFIEAYREVSGI